MHTGIYTLSGVGSWYPISWVPISCDYPLFLERLLRKLCYQLCFLIPSTFLKTDLNFSEFFPRKLRGFFVWRAANGAIEQIFRTIKRVSGGHWSLMREIQKGFKLEGRYSNSLNGIWTIFWEEVHANSKISKNNGCIYVIHFLMENIFEERVKWVSKLSLS